MDYTFKEGKKKIILFLFPLLSPSGRTRKSSNILYFISLIESTSIKVIGEIKDSIFPNRARLGTCSEIETPLGISTLFEK